MTKLIPHNIGFDAQMDASIRAACKERPQPFGFSAWVREACREKMATTKKENT